MKIFNSTLLLSVIITMLGSVSNAEGWGSTKEKIRPCNKQLMLQLRTNVGYPDFARAEEIEGVVVVQLDITNDSKVLVTNIQSSDPRLQQYVKEKLDGLKIPGAPCDAKEMTMKFNFILE